jgi:UDP-N-acetylmuramate--alanine ligase
MKNFVTPSTPFASALVGKGDIFVSEVDESDGSIARYTPTIAVLNNVSLDHKSLDELRTLFRNFIARARAAVMNRDNAETLALASNLPAEDVIDFSMIDSRARLFASKFDPAPDGVSFRLKECDSGVVVPVRLHVPGAHNVANALAAIGAAMAAGVDVKVAAQAIESFAGIRRRLELVGTAKGITVIDDFAHNPDKIAATLATLHAFPGRLLLMFQPHGFGPLRLMKDLFVDCFASNMRTGDVLMMPDPVYFGGTTTRTVTSADIIEGVEARGHEAYAFHDRAACGDKLVELARSGDRVVIMGARDDTLSTFAAEILRRL